MGILADQLARLATEEPPVTRTHNQGDCRVTAGHHGPTLHHFVWARRVIRLEDGATSRCCICKSEDKIKTNQTSHSTTDHFLTCRYSTVVYTNGNTRCSLRRVVYTNGGHALFCFCRRLKQIADTLRFRTYDSNNAPTTPNTPPTSSTRRLCPR